MLFSISSGIPGYCISFPFSLLFVAEDRLWLTPLPLPLPVLAQPPLPLFPLSATVLVLFFYRAFSSPSRCLRRCRLRRQEQRQRRWQLPAIVLISAALS